jgi:hypothetical protein
MASAELSRRVEKVVGYPPLSETGDRQRRGFHEALLEAATLEDLPGKWQAAVLAAEQNRPELRAVSTGGRRSVRAVPGEAMPAWPWRALPQCHSDMR